MVYVLGRFRFFNLMGGNIIFLFPLSKGLCLFLLNIMTSSSSVSSRGGEYSQVLCPW
uniref:Uncharacterized protein n=1 Tax=Arundo donax TaxID=35708 RepID=A0A0A9FY76_ARUDO